MARDVLTLRVSAAGLAHLDELAHGHGLSRTAVIRVLLAVAARHPDEMRKALTLAKELHS